MHMYRCVQPTLLCDFFSGPYLSHIASPLTRGPSSLVTGSRSHKLVTSDVSRILWYYYNDSVSALSLTLACPLASWCAANPVFHVCRERTLFRLPLLDEMDPNAHLRFSCPKHCIVSPFIPTHIHLARAHGGFVVLGLPCEEHH